jgi:hypothetical protein
MAEVHKSMRCWHEVKHIPEQAYSRSTDGRKANAVRAKRRTLVRELSGYADPDGTNIKVSVETLVKNIGWSRRTVLRLLKDLEEMGLLLNRKLTKWNGTRVRALNIPAILGLRPVEVQNSPVVEVQNSASSSAKQPPVEVQNSRVEVPNGIPSSAKQHADTPANPAIWHTTVTPTVNQPTIPSAPQGGAADGWRKFVEKIQPSAVLAEAAMTTKQEGQLRELIDKHGFAITADAALRWVAQRNFSKMEVSPWHFFLRECQRFIADAIAATPEAEQAAQETAMQYGQRIAREQLAEAEARNPEEKTAEEWAAIMKQTCEV